MTIIIIIIIITQQVFIKALAQKHKCQIQNKANTYGIASSPATATTATTTSTTNTTKINQVLAQQSLSVHQITLLLMHVLTQQPQFK
jgi:hypothetical protein